MSTPAIRVEVETHDRNGDELLIAVSVSSVLKPAVVLKAAQEAAESVLYDLAADSRHDPLDGPPT